MCDFFFAANPAIIPIHADCFVPRNDSVGFSLLSGLTAFIS